MRFDEVELWSPAGSAPIATEVSAVVARTRPAPFLKRSATLFTDLSLFVALALALSPVLPSPINATTVAALLAFVVLVSFYYFVGSWMMWGKTIGGIIFDVKVIAVAEDAITFKNAARRWIGLALSILTAGLGFLANLPGRLSGTSCVSGEAAGREARP